MHRMEGRWADRQSAAEDASLPEPPPEPAVSNELLQTGGTRSQLSLASSCLSCAPRFWQAGLTDPVVASLVNTTPLCSSLRWEDSVVVHCARSPCFVAPWITVLLCLFSFFRVVSLEGNTLPEHCFHCLLSEDSVWVTKQLHTSQSK